MFDFHSSFFLINVYLYHLCSNFEDIFDTWYCYQKSELSLFEKFRENNLHLHLNMYGVYKSKLDYVYGYVNI